MKNILYLLVLLSSYILQAQTDTINLKQIIVSDSKLSYKIFQKKIDQRKLYIGRKQASFKIEKENQLYQGTFFLTNLTIDSLTLKNDEIRKIGESVIKPAYTSWYMVYKELLKEFICQQIDNQQWNFISYKSSKKLKIEELDNFEMKVFLSEKGKLLQNTFILFPKKGETYKMDVFFVDFENKIEIKKIKGEFVEKKIIFEIDF